MMVLVFCLSTEEKENSVPVCKLSFTSQAEMMFTQPSFTVAKQSSFD